MSILLDDPKDDFEDGVAGSGWAYEPDAGSASAVTESGGAQKLYTTWPNPGKAVARRLETFDARVPSGHTGARVHIRNLASVTAESEFTIDLKDKASGNICRLYLQLYPGSIVGYRRWMNANGSQNGGDYSIALSGYNRFEWGLSADGSKVVPKASADGTTWDVPNMGTADVLPGGWVFDPTNVEYRHFHDHHYWDDATLELESFNGGGGTGTLVAVGSGGGGGGGGGSTPATITTAQSGNFNDPTTWVGGAVPTAGQKIIKAAGHTLTIPSGYTTPVLGDPAVFGPAVTINGNDAGTDPLVVVGTLRYTGRAIHGNAPCLLQGGTVELDRAAAHGQATEWQMGQGYIWPHGRIQTSKPGATRPAFKSGAGSNPMGKITPGANASGNMHFEDCDVTAIDIQYWFLGTGFLTLKNSRFQGCKMIRPYIGEDNIHFNVRGSSFLGGLDTYDVELQAGTGTGYGRDIVGNLFKRGVRLQAGQCSIRGNFFHVRAKSQPVIECFGNAGIVQWGSDAEPNIVAWSPANAGDATVPINLPPPATYARTLAVVLDHTNARLFAYNPSGWTDGATGCTISRWLLQNAHASDNEGDPIIVNGGTGGFGVIVEQCISLPNAHNKAQSSWKFTNPLNANSGNVGIAVRHCTIFSHLTNSGGIEAGENLTVAPGTVIYGIVKDNIVVHPAAATSGSASSGGTGWFLYRVDAPTLSNNRQDLFNRANIAGNTLFGLATGETYGVKGTSAPNVFSTPLVAGTHYDVRDPAFFDRRLRDLGLYYKDKVADTGTNRGNLEAALTELEKRWDPAGTPDPDFAGSLASILDWIEAGYAPTNPSETNAATDGTTRGAVAAVPPTATAEVVFDAAGRTINLASDATTFPSFTVGLTSLNGATGYVLTETGTGAAQATGTLGATNGNTNLTVDPADVASMPAGTTRTVTYTVTPTVGLADTYVLTLVKAAAASSVGALVAASGGIAIGGLRAGGAPGFRRVAITVNGGGTVSDLEAVLETPAPWCFIGLDRTTTPAQLLVVVDPSAQSAAATLTDRVLVRRSSNPAGTQIAIEVSAPVAAPLPTSRTLTFTVRDEAGAVQPNKPVTLTVQPTGIVAATLLSSTTDAQGTVQVQVLATGSGVALVSVATAKGQAASAVEVRG